MEQAGHIGINFERDVTTSQADQGRHKMRYALLWLLGIPIPVLIIIWLLFGR
jgi:hypothetical protein